MGKQIPQDFLNDLIARTDLVELIQSRVKIQKKGQNYSGLCPFHTEKTPSFSVNPQKQFYYCFGCGAHGNAVGFLMAFDRMEFVDAVEDLSAKLGVEIPLENTTAKATFKQDLDLLNQANDFYQQSLRRSALAIDYLKSRGLTGQIAKHFQIGFAPNEWDSLIKLIKQAPEQLEQLKQQGLVIQKESGKYYDRFRHRIMFPIRDQRGRVIAFGGRAIDDSTPKYLNSPETPLFHKSQELYGLFETLQSNRKLSSILIVEGYMDVIALHQHGITNAVATLGTATNVKHLQKLFRFTNEVIFCFDGDNAGRQAAKKALTMNLGMIHDGVQLRFMFLPSNEDPDSLIRRVGKTGFQQRLTSAQPLSVAFFELLKEETPLDTPDNKALYAKNASKYLNEMPKGIFRDLMFEKLARELNVYMSNLNKLQTPLKSKKRLKNKRLLNVFQHVIALTLQEPKLAQENTMLEKLKGIDLPGIELLKHVIQQLQQNPETTVGGILAGLEIDSQREEVAMLAARKLPFQTEAILAEFSGAIAQIQKQYEALKTEQLIEKAKLGQITDEEKKNLNQLLTQRHKDLI